MYYYIRTAHAGWQEVNKQRYRDFVDFLRQMFPTAVNINEIIALRTYRNEYQLDICDLMGGVERE